MVKKILILMLLSLLMVPLSARAEETKVIQLAVLHPVQFFPADEAIEGLSLNMFYAINKTVRGLSLGLGVNKTTEKEIGVEFGLGNLADGTAYAWQAGVVNYVGKRFVGLQTGVVNATDGDYTGVGLGLVNWTGGYMHGIQCGLVNVSKGGAVGLDLGVVNYNGSSFQGFQCGFVNYAKEMHGLQLGVVNSTQHLDGLQVGLCNYNGNRKDVKFLPIANWSF